MLVALVNRPSRLQPASRFGFSLRLITLAAEPEN
jgi:hypothetical protein